MSQLVIHWIQSPALADGAAPYMLRGKLALSDKEDAEMNDVMAYWYSYDKQLNVPTAKNNIQLPTESRSHKKCIELLSALQLLCKNADCSVRERP